jgi:hypothetical protein
MKEGIHPTYRTIRRYTTSTAATGDRVAEMVVSRAGLAGDLAGGAAVWLAARIYRVGLLMYGKRPTLRELGHWIRYA